MVVLGFSPSFAGRPGGLVRLIAAGVVAVGLLLPLTFAPSASGAPVSVASALVLTTDTPLSTVGLPTTVGLGGDLGSPYAGARAEIVVQGPGPPSAGGAGLAETYRAGQDLGDLPAQPTSTLTLPPTAMPVPGGYLVTVTLTSSTGGPAKATLWLGRLGVTPPDVDIALVVPAALGVHRSPDGVLVDGVLQAAVVPRADAPGSLYGLLGPLTDYTQFRLTLGIEPLLPDELAAMAGGYTQIDPRGGRVVVPKSAEGARNAGRTLDVLKQLASRDGVQIIPGPYSLPSLALLGQLGWPDGFEQMRLGKAQVKSGLDVADVMQGAYAPGLDITTDSLPFFSRSSIDFTVVGADVARDLAEKPADISVPVRIRGPENDRLTLFFADSELRAAFGRPWDANRFLAALAHEVAQGKRGPFTVSASDDYGPPTGAFMEGVLRSLSAQSWVHPRTIDEMIALHPPSTRPIFLTRYGGIPQGYVPTAFIERLKTAHALSDDYVGSATSDRAPLSRLRLLLYTGESRYWFARGENPAVINLGLSYLDAAIAFVKKEFSKVSVAEKSVSLVGKEGEVPVAVVNQTGYPLKVDLVLKGAGLSFRGGSRHSVTLGTGENIYSFPVTSTAANAVLSVRVVAGDTEVAHGDVKVRSLTVRSLVPWILAGLLVIGGGLGLVLRLRA